MDVPICPCADTIILTHLESRSTGHWSYLKMDFFPQQAAKIVVASFSLPSELNRTGTNMTLSKHG